MPDGTRLPPHADQEDCLVDLRVLATTDLHAHIKPWDYFSDRPSLHVGLSLTASLIRRARAEVRNSILVDNGDYLQGSPMGDWAATPDCLGPGDLHPVISAMNTLGYDCGTLGNHEFNYGVPFLDRVNAGARFPIVCCNFARELGATPLLDRLHQPPYAILTREVSDRAGRAQTLRIGLIGFVPPQIMRWDRNHLSGQYAARDIMEAARVWVPHLRAAGADVVIALSHSGIMDEPGRKELENASLSIAALPGIDAVVTGHTHQIFPGPDFPRTDVIDPDLGLLHGKPAVMAGFWGSHLGIMDIALRRENGRWRREGGRSHVTSLADLPTPPIREGVPMDEALPADPAVRAAVRGAHLATLDHVRRPVAKTRVPMHSFFSLICDTAAVQVVNDSQIAHLQRVLAGGEFAGLPVLSAFAPFKAGGRGGPRHFTDIPPGQMSLRHIADLYFYPNIMQALLVDGAGLHEWLEMSASIFHQIRPGVSGQVLLQPGFPSYDFDVIDGVSYEIDITQPARYSPGGSLRDPQARRIRNLCRHGRPVAAEDSFIVATNAYRAGGGGNFPGLEHAPNVLAGTETCRDILRDYLAAQDVADPRPDHNWRLAPAGGAEVFFDTGPGATRHLDSLPGLDIRAVGHGTSGFLCLSLRL